MEISLILTVGRSSPTKIALALLRKFATTCPFRRGYSCKTAVKGKFFIHFASKIDTKLSNNSYFWAASLLQLGLAPIAEQLGGKSPSLRIILGYDINCHFLPYLAVSIPLKAVYLYVITFNLLRNSSPN